jgi:hypothetical protein
MIDDFCIEGAGAIIGRGATSFLRKIIKGVDIFFIMAKIFIMETENDTIKISLQKSHC